MKYEIILQMLFDLLINRTLSSKYFSQKYHISERTVYRYLEILMPYVPIRVKRGRTGGICISDAYKLPVGFLKTDEYDAAMTALTMAYSYLPDKKFLAAKQKLSLAYKEEKRQLFLSENIENILIDSNTWGDSRHFSDMLRLLEQCLRDCAVMEIEYSSKSGEKIRYKIEPHVLVYQKNTWFIYAFCRVKRDFCLFRVSQIFSAILTEEKFNRRPINKENILSEENTTSLCQTVIVETDEKGYDDTLDFIGYHALKSVGKNCWRAEVSLPFNECLVKKIVSIGGHIRVISPEELREKVRAAAEEILNNY